MAAESTVIVSVYKDNTALRVIINSLLEQSAKNFDVIVSEDGCSDNIRKLVSELRNLPFNLLHLSQQDNGFRKNIALNRAVKESNTEHLIFIDGDCVLHPKFVSAHQAYAAPGTACSGRRLELGKTFSGRLRNNSYSLKCLTSRLYFFANIPLLMRDKTKNIECGIYSKLLQFITRNRNSRLLGCNFSCNKQDLFKVNGFNEDYRAAGTGEDSDIDWRLVKSGVQVKKVKFSAIQYHLYHPRSYGTSLENNRLLEITKSSDDYRCINGLIKP